MPKRNHDRFAKEVEPKVGVPYNRGEGVDFPKPGMPMDVKVDPDDLKSSIRSMSQRGGLPYVIVPPELEDYAKQVTKKTRVGVRNKNLKIIKSAKRKKRGR